MLDAILSFLRDATPVINALLIVIIIGLLVRLVREFVLVRRLSPLPRTPSIEDPVDDAIVDSLLEHLSDPAPKSWKATLSGYLPDHGVRERDHLLRRTLDAMVARESNEAACRQFVQLIREVEAIALIPDLCRHLGQPTTFLRRKRNSSIRQCLWLLLDELWIRATERLDADEIQPLATRCRQAIVQALDDSLSDPTPLRIWLRHTRGAIGVAPTEEVPMSLGHRIASGVLSPEEVYMFLMECDAAHAVPLIVSSLWHASEANADETTRIRITTWIDDELRQRALSFDRGQRGATTMEVTRLRGSFVQPDDLYSLGDIPPQLQSTP